MLRSSASQRRKQPPCPVQRRLLPRHPPPRRVTKPTAPSRQKPPAEHFSRSVAAQCAGRRLRRFVGGGSGAGATDVTGRAPRSHGTTPPPFATRVLLRRSLGDTRRPVTTPTAHQAETVPAEQRVRTT